jgi:DNA-binding GntR family transcriptional regulator
MGESSSRTVNVYRKVRTDILAGRLTPNRKLRIQELAESLDVSPSVVREALSRLSAETLVIAEPQRGFRVAPINADDVRDLTEVRIDIEAKCLRRAIGRGDIAWESEIVAAQHALMRARYDSVDVSDEWTAAHARFHYALVAACDSQWLLRLREQLFIQGERYRCINLRMSNVERDLIDEHAHIADAVIAREVDRATELMAKHLKRTEALTLQSLQTPQAEVA